jgi:misacylated tRNA(Ala) deacylase
MTEPLYRDAYRREAPFRVIAHTEEGGVVLDAALFYPTGGGQPGDAGRLDWPGGTLRVATTVKGEGGAIVLVPGTSGPAAPGALPPVGTEGTQRIDWETRHAHMRVHTALHLLSVVIPLPVTGGSISAGKGRLDFDMAEPPQDREALGAALADLVARDLPVTEDWITDAELAANPGLVKTMSVAPPTGQGLVRLVRIGEGEAQVDLQPCGGTHVGRTGEIGAVRIGKIEKKGARNRRVTVHLD